MEQRRVWWLRRRGEPVGAGAVMVVLALAAGALHAESRLEGSLPRRADLGFRVTEQGATLAVGKVEPGSAAAAAGLVAGERILSIDGRRFEQDYVGADLLRRVDGGQRVTLELQGADTVRAVAFQPPPLALEQLEGVDSVYGVLDTPDGTRLRTIVTRPTGARGPLPAIFVTQWVSCDSIELLKPQTWLDPMRAVAERAGMVMIRVERSSGGDSEGPGCHQLDYDTELAQYRFAFDRLTRSPVVDASRVVIWGNSLGSTTAPLLASGRQVAGVMISGGGALTYFERMLQFDRIGFERGDMDPREIDQRMKRHAEFHVEYLLRGRDPQEIVAQYPHLAEVWGRIRGSGDGVHYGRPFAYHRQAAAKDFLASWADLAAPVLAIFSEYDQFELAHGHRTIVDTVNRLRPGSARYVELPQMGHDYRVYPDARAAAAWRSGQGAPELVAAPVLQWLRELELSPPPAVPVQ